MTTKTVTICDGCLREIESVFLWTLTSPTGGFTPDKASHFCELKCLGAAVARELARPPQKSDGPVHYIRKPFA